jgi:LacI family transcriptional regulator
MGIMMDTGNINVTIKEVALAAGVSIATVSRVLNHNQSVTEQTRRRVVEVMHELGYNRNEVARSLKVRHTRTIGIIAPELSNVFFMEVVEAMERILAPKGYTMIIGSSNDSVAEEKRKLQVLIERNVDGLVVMPAGAEGEHLLSKSLTNIPLVMVDRRIPGLEVDSVLTDNRYGVHQMIRALKAEGFNRIGYIGGDPAIHTAGERLYGFYDAMREYGLPIEERFILHEGAMVQSAGRKLLKKALQIPGHPDAFFIANDSMHLGATSYAMESLTNAERDRLVFASFDYLEYAPLLRLCHYAVAQPLERIGEEVAALLLKRLKGDKEGFPEHVVLRPEIKIMSANGGRPFETRSVVAD